MKNFLLLTVCAGSLIAGFNSLAGAKGGPPPNYSVTIEDTLSDGTTATTIRSDGLGPYINGVDGVQVALGFINFWPRADRGTRNVNFNNAGVYPSRQDLPVPNDTATPPTGLTGGTLQDPHTGGPGGLSIAMDGMTVGASQCGTFYWVVRDAAAGQAWRVPNFHYTLANVPESSYVVVTRNSATQWTIESSHGVPCSDNPYNVGMVLHDVTTTVGKKTTVTTYADGYYYVPFRLTLVQQ